MERNEAKAYPLLGYRLLANPRQPEVSMIEFKTEVGPSLFGATKEILEELAEAFRRHAANMPKRPDQQ